MNLTDKLLKFQIGNSTIKIEPYAEFLVNLRELEHVKKSVMRRALALLPKLHADRLEVIDLQKQEEAKQKEKNDKKTKRRKVKKSKK